MNDPIRNCPTGITRLTFVVAVIWCSMTLGEDLAGSPPVPPVPEDVNVQVVIPTVAVEPLLLTGESRTPPPASRRGPTGPLTEWTVLGAIAATFVVLAAYRYRQTRRRSRDLPTDVFDVLGEGSLGGQHAVRIVRFGPRTLLVGISAAGCQTLATLDDPQATERIVTACLGSRAPRPPRGVTPVRHRVEPAGEEAP